MTTTTAIRPGTLLVRTDSGVVFRVTRIPNHQGWVVMASIGRQSTTARAIVGMKFHPGGNPHWYARGYAQIVQRAINEYQEAQP